MKSITHKFNHRILDQLNTGFFVYQKALNWALEREHHRKNPGAWFERLHTCSELHFEYTIDFEKGTVSVAIFRRGDLLLTQTEDLPCVEGGPAVIESVMGACIRIETDKPESAKISAAGNVVQALEGICKAYLRAEANRIDNREFGNELFHDRYQLCYME